MPVIERPVTAKSPVRYKHDRPAKSLRQLNDYWESALAAENSQETVIVQALPLVKTYDPSGDHKQEWFTRQVQSYMIPEVPEALQVVPLESENFGNFYAVKLDSLNDGKPFTLLLDNSYQFPVSSNLYLVGQQVWLRYPKRGSRVQVDHYLLRAITGRYEDYWSVELRDLGDGHTFDYRRSNIRVEKAADIKAHEKWLTEENGRNIDKPDRMMQIDGHRVNQVFDVNHITADPLNAKSIKPKGYGSEEPLIEKMAYSRGDVKENGVEYQIPVYRQNDAGENATS